MAKKEGISLDGYEGTYYEIDSRDGLYLMESEKYGDDVPAVIIDEDNNIVVADVYNGWLDLDEDEDEDGYVNDDDVDETNYNPYMGCDEWQKQFYPFYAIPN